MRELVVTHSESDCSILGPDTVVGLNNGSILNCCPLYQIGVIWHCGVQRTREALLFWVMVVGVV